jgi:hypothetical protein
MIIRQGASGIIAPAIILFFIWAAIKAGRKS